MENPELIKFAIGSTKNLFTAEDLAMNEEALKLWLVKQVKDMLDHDFNGLVNLLYRIDVFESKAKNCFGRQNHEIAECLAGLIWERQLQKAMSRFGG